MIRTCLKCSHVNSNASGEQLEPCPACGAIYSKVEAWVQRQAAAEKAAAATAAAARTQRYARTDDMTVAAFVRGMRAESLYPTFRTLVTIVYWILMALAAMALIGAIGVLFREEDDYHMLAFWISAVMSVFFWVVGSLLREVALMFADLSDASVRTAASLAGKTQP